MKRVAGVGSVAVMAAMLLASVAGTAKSQTGAVITGKVTNDQGAPVPNANVFIPALGVGAYASAAGTYSIIVPASRTTRQQTTLSARSIGFIRQNRQISLGVGNQTQDFTLRVDPLRLEPPRKTRMVPRG